MDNLNNNGFYSEDQWQNLSTPVVKTEYTEPEEDFSETGSVKKREKHSKHPVLTIQLTLSLCVLLFVFIVKFLSTPLYEGIMRWYDYEISKSVIYNFDFENLDFSSIFATPDES